MKFTKVVFWCVIGVSLLMLSAKPQNTRAAVYDNRSFISGDIPEGGEHFLSVSTFERKKNGVVKLVGDEFRPRWSGLVHLSGSCHMKRPPTWFTVKLQVGESEYFLGQGGQTVSFDITVPADVMRVKVSQETPGNVVNGAQCNLLFQAVR